MTSNLFKRVITSIFLLFVLIYCLFFNFYIWSFLIVAASIISFFEFSNLVKKIWKKDNQKVYLLNLLTFCYLLFFSYSAYDLSKVKLNIFFILLVCIFSDIGGYVIGKTFGGKKLTKISPNKTISGSFGSFIFSLIPIFIYETLFKGEIFTNTTLFILITFLISLICQIGDLLISYFKRKAKAKDTGSILPGHGGLLDRIDGLIFVVPFIFFIQNFIINIF